MALATSRHFVAAFVDIVLDGGETLRFLAAAVAQFNCVTSLVLR